MSPRRAGPRLLVVMLFASLANLGGGGATAAAGPASEVTTPVEAARVDRVPTPVLDWERCGQSECAKALVPLDYDEPQGAQIELALARLKAGDPGRRVGSLFINPGGPGLSAVKYVKFAPHYFKPELLERFDLIGVDPRGTNGSTPLRCFSSLKVAQQKLAGQLATPLPTTAPEKAAAVRSARATARACSRQPIAAAMSTAEVARDMDVVRRALGEPAINYYGESYGSFLGQVYANMFPDRIRTLVIDGVIEPRGWVGSPASAAVSTFVRVGSPQASGRAFDEILRRCRRVGRARCAFASGNPQARFRALAARLRAQPLQVDLPGTGRTTIGYPQLIGTIKQLLYSPLAFKPITDGLAAVWSLDHAGSSAIGVKAARKTLAKLLAPPKTPPSKANQEEAVEGFVQGRAIICTDGLHAAKASNWPLAAAAAERRNRFFGAVWSWIDAPCATDDWTAQDEDAYRGPFDRRTDAPVLIVGSRWDNATNYDSAVAVSRLLPNSQLLTSDNWGHTAYSASACAAHAIDRYLITASLPRLSHCPGDIQPFAGD